MARVTEGHDREGDAALAERESVARGENAQRQLGSQKPFQSGRRASLERQDANAAFKPTRTIGARKKTQTIVD
jgi:hypothetical protein